MNAQHACLSYICFIDRYIFKTPPRVKKELWPPVDRLFNGVQTMGSCYIAFTYREKKASCAAESSRTYYANCFFFFFTEGGLKRTEILWFITPNKRCIWQKMYVFGVYFSVWSCILFSFHCVWFASLPTIYSFSSGPTHSVPRYHHAGYFHIYVLWGNYR